MTFYPFLQKAILFIAVSLYLNKAIEDEGGLFLSEARGLLSEGIAMSDFSLPYLPKSDIEKGHHSTLLRSSSEAEAFFEAPFIF